MCKISIIMPAYNAEKYLKSSVESILAQSFEDFELIIVDDGSKDSTPSVCDAYAAQDGRIKVIHKQNGGVSDARNTGIDAAAGKYICFVDADDRVKNDYLSAMLSALEKDDVDFVAASYTMEKSLGRTRNYVYSEKTFDEAYISENLLEIFREMENAPWAKLFKADIIKDHAVRFPQNIPYSEDSYFCVEYFKYIRSAKLIPDIVYYYNWTNPEAAMKKFFPDICVYLAAVLNKKREFYEYKCKLDRFEEKKYDDIDFRFSICLEHYIPRVHDKAKLYEYIEYAAKTLHYDENMKAYQYCEYICNCDWNGVRKHWINTHRYMYANYTVRHLLGQM